MSPAAVGAQTWRLHVFTPVHVGSGAEARPGLDILATGRNLTYVLDWNRLLASLPPDTAAADAVSQALRPGSGSREAELLRALDGAGLALDAISLAQLEGDWPRGNLRLQIRRADGAALLPGSSIKGALRTAALAACLAKRGPDLEVAFRDLVAHRLARLRGRRGVRPKGSELVEEPLLAPSPASPPRLDAPHRDLLRLLGVGDATFPSEALRVTRVEIHQCGGAAGEDRRLSTKLAAECLAPGSSARVRLEWNDALRALGREGGLWRTGEDLSFEDILRSARGLARHHLDHDRARFDAAGLSRAAAAVGALRRLADDEDLLVLRLGWGIGWEGTTGGFADASLREEIREVDWRDGPTRTWSRRNFPATRKLVSWMWRPQPGGPARAFEGYQLPLGWVVLEPEGLGRVEVPEWPARPATPVARSRGPAPPTHRQARRERREEPPGPAPTAVPRRRAIPVSVPPAGEEVTAVVLEKRTSKGKPRFEIEGTSLSGSLAGSSEAPPSELAAGTRVRLRVKAPDSRGQNIQFEWIGLADDRDPGDRPG